MSQEIKNLEQILEILLSTDCNLKLGYMKVELQIIMNQNVIVKMYLGRALIACHTLEVGLGKSFIFNFIKGLKSLIILVKKSTVILGSMTRVKS